MTEFKFTIDQIKDIFQSGVDRGHDEAADLKWGSFSSECRFSGCIGAVYDTINHGKKYDDGKPFIGECEHCECKVECTKSEIQYNADQRDGNYYYVLCPECKRFIYMLDKRLL